MNDKGAYRFGMDGESVSMVFRMARGYKDIEKVLYSVLTDDPETHIGTRTGKKVQKQWKD